MCQDQSPAVLTKHSGTWAIEWSPDGKFIAFGGDDSVLTIISAHDYHVTYSNRMKHLIKGLSWHPDGKRLAVALNNTAGILDISSHNFKYIPQLSTGGRAIAWNRSGSLLALADGGGVVQIISNEGKLIRSIRKHNNHSYLSVDWHPSKDILVTGSDEIILFDTSGRQLRMIQHRKEATGVLTVRWHPSGKFFASGDYGHEGEGVPSLLQFWNEDGKLLKTMLGSHAEYRNIRWNRTGTLLATASDGLRIWDADGSHHRSGKTDYNIWGVSWNDEGTRIVSASFEGNIDLWNSNAEIIRHLTAK